MEKETTTGLKMTNAGHGFGGTDVCDFSTIRRIRRDGSAFLEFVNNVKI